jgi:hypothetical protein
VKLGIKGFDGSLVQGPEFTGPSENVIINLRNQTQQISSLTNSQQLKGLGNLAIARIDVLGRTRSGLEMVFTRPIGEADVLQVFSSGKGSAANERVKLEIVDTKGRVLRAGDGTAGQSQIVLSSQIVVIGETDVGAAEYESLLKFAQLIPQEAKINPQLHKHSEQAIFKMFTERDAEIAAWVESLGIVAISQFVVNIHSEREMCGNCAAAMNSLMSNMEELASKTYEALQKMKQLHPPGVNTSSSVSFSQSAPQDQQQHPVNVSSPTPGGAQVDPNNPPTDDQKQRLAGLGETPIPTM